MTYALYGTNGIYADAVETHGIERNTAACFLVSDMQDESNLFATLICSIYHGIGLSVLSDTIKQHKILSQVLEEINGIELLLFPFPDIIPAQLYTYEYQGLLTCPYIKIREIGVVSGPAVLKIHIPLSFFEIRIDSPDSIPTPRFFRKSTGKPQFISGCYMHELEKACSAAATFSLPIVKDFLIKHLKAGGKDEID